jgi:succinate dehydrogenase / fumarate reductase flavoprotein subunit
MGGVPTNLNCVVLDGEKEVSGLMAIGEVACVSVHGANRLGCNSLLDLIVFGKIAGKFASEVVSEFAAKKAANFSSKNSNITLKIAQEKIEKLKNIFDFNKSCNLDLQELKLDLQKNNEKNLAVFREEKMLKDGLQKTLELFAIFKNHKIHSQNLVWNEELIAYLELKNLFLNSLAANFSAINRTESRGAHYRSDFKNRDDQNFHAHSLVKASTLKENKFEYSLKPIRTLATIPELNSQLQIRKY